MGRAGLRGPSGYKNLGVDRANRLIARSRGGSCRNIDHLLDWCGCAFQVGDAPMFPGLMGHLRVVRDGSGRPRTYRGRVWGGMAYSSRAIRPHPRQRGISSSSPNRMTSRGTGNGRGRRGSRPVSLDVQDFHVVQRGFNKDKQCLGLATRYDKLALTYRGRAALRAITLWLKQLGEGLPRQVWAQERWK